VVVDERLRQLERMAFDFVMNFARDNDLQVFEGCSLPETASPPVVGGGSGR
jgi:NADPH-dependent glutamate synthase beta subunit-like oxidoreductase